MSVTVTANAVGPAGNSISLAIQNLNVPLAALSISTVGTAITVTVQTDAGGVNISTNLQVKNLINGDPTASALVTASTADPGDLVPVNGGAQFLMGGAGSATGGSYCGQDLGNFKILMLDQNQVQISNIPILFTNFFHVPNNPVSFTSQGNAAAVPKNFWPCPAMAYRVNSNIRFYLYVTSATPLAAPVTFDITFSGIRRYPCK